MNTRIVTSLPVTELPVGVGNWDPTRRDITKIVLHTMVGTIAGANARFNKPNEQASAHYGVGLDGSIVHWVDEDNTSYAAGNYQVNQECINIEHEDGGDYNGPRTPELYETSARLVADICKFYGIPANRDYIKIHREVSQLPTACPDSLDFDRIIARAKYILDNPDQFDGFFNPVPQPEIPAQQPQNPLTPSTPEPVVPAPVSPVEAPKPVEDTSVPTDIPTTPQDLPKEGVNQMKLQEIISFLDGKKTIIGIALGAAYSVLIYFGLAPDNALIWTALAAWTGVSARLAIK